MAHVRGWAESSSSSPVRAVSLRPCLPTESGHSRPSRVFGTGACRGLCIYTAHFVPMGKLRICNLNNRNEDMKTKQGYLSIAQCDCSQIARGPFGLCKTILEHRCATLNCRRWIIKLVRQTRRKLAQGDHLFV